MAVTKITLRRAAAVIVALAYLIVTCAAVPLAAVVSSFAASFPKIGIPPRVFREIMDSSFAPVGKPEDIAKQFISGLTKTQESQLSISNKVSSSGNGVTNIYLAHMVNNLPVVNLISNVNVDSKGTVISAGSASIDGGKLQMKSGAKTTAIQALVEVAKGLGYNPIDIISRLKMSPDGKTITGAPFAQTDVSAIPKLYYLPSGDLDPIWDLVVKTETAWYNFWVSGTSGKILAANNWVSDFGYKRSTTTRISTSTRPPASTSSTASPLPTDRPVYRAIPFNKDSLWDGTQRITRPADGSSSPLGWHSSTLANGELNTQGNNVRASYLDQTVSSGNGQQFDYTYTTTSQPSTSFSASVVNIFYVTNKYHDVFYKYGFTEAAGNFQANNNGKGGSGNDAIQANAQVPGGNCNANFATPGDGFTPVMNFYTCNAANPSRDTGMDNGVILHELTHGLTNRLTGGPSNPNCLATTISGGMGEGWSDTVAWWATMKSTDTRATNKVIGAYSFNRAGGIRRYPYSTNTATNPLLYSNLQTLSVVHNVGEVWSTMLYEVYWNMVEVAGYEADLALSTSQAGNIRFMQNLVDALKLQPCNPSFVDARNAFLQAETVNHNGRFRPTMLEAILDRLVVENLHGATSPYSPPSGNRGSRPRSAVEDESWTLVQQQEDDMDAKDPRWLELFIEYFLEMETTTNDDLLFFVRQQDQMEPDQEPIFVKRKVGKTMPTLSDMIDWKQTFFLNLIIQLPCTLTVAVCRRSSAASDAKKKSLLTKASSERVVVVGGGPPVGSSNEEGTELQNAGRPSEASSNALGEESPYGSSTSIGSKPTASTSNTSSPKPAPRSRMIALRRITKKVYAAPYKSRMDIKDAFMNEISYPLVYYTVNDYESFDLHLEIKEREYLCVELSVTLPNDPSRRDLADEVAAISLEDDSAPFPVPAGCNKIILFQGAVPFSSLLDIYQQKGLAAHNQRSSWGKLPTPGAPSGGRPREGSMNGGPPLSERTEYIMMRGPHGKGQCQVSIREYMQIAETNESTAPASSTPKVTTLSDRLRFIGSTVRAGINAVAGTTSTPPQTATVKKPDTLVCSMTYVNVPWQSIISDLMDYKKLQRQSGASADNTNQKST
ncbi:Fungalysin/Thermolysin Extracellular metalloproteinase 5 [Dinochytrium kinnereticum]|nr:Fungalysin/Thermolysin Extracellular metalloproteinase 5 [Dinochytrium kinnereticum]